MFTVQTFYVITKGLKNNHSPKRKNILHNKKRGELITNRHQPCIDRSEFEANTLIYLY